MIETGEFIGDCGISIQNIDGEMLPEIGYHIHKRYWRKGFGKEIGFSCRKHLRGILPLYSITSVRNLFVKIKTLTQ